MPTSLPTSPSSMPTSVPTMRTGNDQMKSTDNTVLLLSIILPVLGGLLIISFVYNECFRKKKGYQLLLIERERKHRLAELPVHSAIVRKFDSAKILTVIEENIDSIHSLDYDHRMALDLALLHHCEDSVVHALLKDSLPVEEIISIDQLGYQSVHIEDRDPVHHGFAWTAVIATPDYTDVVARILQEYPQFCSHLAEAKDIHGRLAVNIATNDCQRLIRQSTFLFRRYELMSNRPQHVSGTCCVYIAIDHDNEEQHVALKLMSEKTQFLREIDIRNSSDVDERFVVSILNHFDGSFDETVRQDLCNKGFSNYLHCLVLSAGERNLAEIISSERIAGQNWANIQHISRDLLLAVQHLHQKHIIHGDLKPKNIMRIRDRMCLIDMDASVRMGIDYVGEKYSSAYLPPEMVVCESRSRQYYSICQNDSSRRVIAAASFDVWSLGVVFYQLFSGQPLFLSDDEDNLDVEELPFLCEFTDSFKLQRLSRIKNSSARNLVSQMLCKDASRRSPISLLIAHPFLTGRKSARMIGVKADFDVFLSYRVESDAHHAEMLYNLLSDAGVKVWWDKVCLEPGVSWEIGFCEGLIRSSIFVPLLSRGAINNSVNSRCNFEQLVETSPCDNVLLEHRLALELQQRGLIEKIYPVLIGDYAIGELEEPEYIDYFSSGCHPSLPKVTVQSVEEKLMYHLSEQSLGTSLLENMTVATILSDITKNQGCVVRGPRASVFSKVVADILVMKGRQTSNHNNGLSSNNNSNFELL